MAKRLIFSEKWVASIQKLPNAERLETYDAVIHYGFNGEVLPLSPTATVAFSFIKEDIDAENARMAAISEKRRQAGRAGGAPKNNSNARKGEKPQETQSATVVEPPKVEPVVPPAKPKKKARKTPEKHHYAEFVLLTEDEHNKLVANYGEDGAQWMITKLDNFKGAKGTNYKSDYRAILNWVVDSYLNNHQQKTQAKRNGPTNFKPSTTKSSTPNYDEDFD